MLLVVSNAAFVGVAMELNMQAAVAEQALPTWLYFGDLVYAVLFSGELVTRFYIERGQFFKGSNQLWNMFDSILLLTAIFDLLVSAYKLTFMRALRILRTIRATRILKTLRQARELRLMVAAVMQSFFSLVWAFAIFFFMMYMFALAILQGVVTYV